MQKQGFGISGSFGLLRALIVATSVALLATGGATAGSGVIGKAAPGFSLPTTKGADVSLAKLKGKVIVLAFFSTDCQPCKKQLPVLESLHRQNLNKNATVVAINIDQKRVFDANLTRSLSFPVALDPMGKISRKYNPAKIPTVYVLDQGGVVRDIKEGWTDVDVLMTLQGMVDRRF